MNTLTPRKRKTMNTSEVQRVILREQRAVMKKIANRRIKIAELMAEVDALQKELDNLAPETGEWWDGQEPTNFEILCSSETKIPMPTVVPEYIRYGANGPVFVSR